MMHKYFRLALLTFLLFTPASAQVIVTGVTGTGAPWHPTNVKQYGAVGDNVADDTAAIQAAIDATANGGHVFFPPGTYKVSATLNVPFPKRLSFRGVSPQTGGSEILGNVSPGPLINMANSTGGGPNGTIIEGLALRNTNATGVTLQITQMQTPNIRNAVIGGYRGVITLGNVYSLFIDNVKFTSSGNVPGSIGLYTGGHTAIYASDFVGWDDAVRASGITVSIIGCRFEVNNTALNLGRDLDNNTLMLQRSLISGNSFEANGTAVKSSGLGNSVLSGLGSQGSVGAPGGFSHYGMDLGGLSGVTIEGINMAGAYDGAAFRVTGATRTMVTNSTASNGEVGKKAWDIRVPLSQITFENTNYSPKGDGVVSKVWEEQAVVKSLGMIDHLEPAVMGRNLRGKNIAVGSGVSTLAIAFAGALDSGAVAINTATATTGGALAPGTYYYIASAVNEAGETGAVGEKTVVVGGANNAVALNLFGAAFATAKRRIYRGTAPGVYDGYFETALGAVSHTDTGAAFTGLKSPMVGGIDADTSLQEPDANYAVIVTPAWNTSVWVTNKATTGFTVNFGTAPGANSSLDWFIVR